MNNGYQLVNDHCHMYCATQQVFQEVCGKHALPMLPMLCLVCCEWRAAVAAAPELWRCLDLSQQRVRVRSKTKIAHMQQSFLRSLRSRRLQQVCVGAGEDRGVGCAGKASCRLSCHAPCNASRWCRDASKPLWACPSG
jgi:hypothetical protein